MGGDGGGMSFSGITSKGGYESSAYPSLTNPISRNGDQEPMAPLKLCSQEASSTFPSNPKSKQKWKLRICALIYISQLNISWRKWLITCSVLLKRLRQLLGPQQRFLLYNHHSWSWETTEGTTMSYLVPMEQYSENILSFVKINSYSSFGMRAKAHNYCIIKICKWHYKFTGHETAPLDILITDAEYQLTVVFLAIVS